MKFKFIYNQKLMNSVFLSLIPLIIPSNNLFDAILICISLITVHILANISIFVIHKHVNNSTYKAPLNLVICVAIPFLLGLIFSMIFNGYSHLIINTACFVAISEILLIALLDVNYNDLKENIKTCLPVPVIISIILIVIAFLRELIGLGEVLGCALPLGNLRPVGLFNQAPGGLLLLGVVVVLYSLLIKNNEEENK